VPKFECPLQQPSRAGHGTGTDPSIPIREENVFPCDEWP